MTRQYKVVALYESVGSTWMNFASYDTVTSAVDQHMPFNRRHIKFPVIVDGLQRLGHGVSVEISLTEAVDERVEAESVLIYDCRVEVAWCLGRFACDMYVFHDCFSMI